MKKFKPEELVLIDTSLRPAGCPAPRLYAAARKQGRAVLAGSDPLPFPGEEELAGSWYSTFSIPPLADPARLIEPLKTALTSETTEIQFAGHRGSPLAVGQRLRQNAKAKDSSQNSGVRNQHR